MAKAIKEGKLARQTKAWGTEGYDPVGVQSSGEIAGQILAPAIVAANN